MDLITFRLTALERQLDAVLTVSTKLAQKVAAQQAELDALLAAITRLEAHDHPPPLTLAVFGSARPPDRAPPMLGDGA
jgi:hypothetical protein